MGRLDTKSVCAVLGFSFLWAYVQKGFLSTRLAWAPDGDFSFASATLLSALLIFIAVFAIGHKTVENVLSRHRPAWFVLLIATALTELVAYFDISALSGLAARAFCIVYYGLHALVLVSLFFAWMIYFVRIAYKSSLPSAIALILVALLLSRIITMPYFFIWDSLAREETIFLVALSGILWLACVGTTVDKDLRFSAELSSSSLMKRYLPAFLLYLFGGIASRIVQSFAEDFWQMQVFNASREIICFTFLALCIAVLFLPKKARVKLSGRDAFFLVTGLVLGIVIGPLLGAGSLPVERLFFDFIETSRAILLVASLLLVFLIVYEESISPVLAFGLFVIGPIIIWRFFNLASENVGPIAIPAWIYLLLLVTIAVAFLVTSLLFIFVFVGSNAFLTSIGGRRREQSERRDIVETIAQDHGLTDRETSVFEYLSMGYTAKRIGEKLYISPYTAQNHIRCIYAKLGVRSKQEVLEFIEDQVSDG